MLSEGPALAPGPRRTAAAPRRWTLVGDVGGAASYHAGDEAMLESNLRLLRAIAPDAVLHAVSADPAFTTRTYGIPAFARLGFDACESDEAREELLDRLSNSHWTGRTPPVFAALADATDGLVISGGGNLRSTWPACIYERLALCRRAVANGAPVVLLGQTLGPELTSRHRDMMAELLRAASWIGVREVPSFELALELGASPERLSYQLDDASDLARETAGRALPPLPFPEGEPWIGVTFHPLADPDGDDDLLDRLAEQLSQVAQRTRCHLLFIPHARVAAAVGAHWSDEDVGRSLARRMRTVTLHLLPVLPADQIARLTARAHLIVSSRYHPIVFGLAGGVPCLGVWVDEYTRTKLQGALGHFDCADDACGISDVLQGQLTSRLIDLWGRRTEARAHLEARMQPNFDDERRRREALARLIVTGAAAVPPRPVRLDQARAAGALARPAMHSTQATGHNSSFSSRDERNRMMLTEAQWQKFWRDGYLHLGQVLDPEQVRTLQERADALALGQVTNPAIQMQHDTGGEYEALPDAVARFEEGTHLYRKIQGLESDDVFARLIDRPLFREICAQMYGSHAAVSIFRAMVMNKPAGQGTHLPWHQDGGTVWQLDRDPLVTIWVALDEATQANGCMDAIPGSHRLGLLSLQGSTLTDEQARRHCLPESVVPLEVPSGHAVLLHNWLIHRSGVNPSPLPRRAFTMCCMDARTRSILTGDRFPIIYGELESTPDPFVQQIRLEQTAMMDKADEAEKYALSLRDAHDLLQGTLNDATVYARSLEAEVAKLRQQGLDLGDSREENKRLIAATTQMRSEILTLNRTLGAKEQAHAEVHGLRVRVAQLAASIEAIHASNSWRITRPLRAVASVLRGRKR
ncbi:phytanoyl-CoA dioxygenase family protein [Variovorax sp. W6]|uniref:phytanoyl-CoA dioxygenase family protein n=1 Tax=Variovorax sp. W6 TaxID=3093895 RepID=UPI003D80128C